MIELQTNPEYLDMLAADHILDGRDATGSDLKAAALDHKNLREYAERLERNVQQLSAEIAEKSRVLGNAETAMEQMQDAIIAVVGGAIDARIKHHLDLNRVDELRDELDALAERVETLEGSDANSDDIREEVREMIRDGEIVVNIDYS
jgi:predicted RNase H-like nuclease (RuvC/YqgF family)